MGLSLRPRFCGGVDGGCVWGGKQGVRVGGWVGREGVEGWWVGWEARAPPKHRGQVARGHVRACTPPPTHTHTLGAPAAGSAPASAEWILCRCSTAAAPRRSACGCVWGEGWGVGAGARHPPHPSPPTPLSSPRPPPLTSTKLSSPYEAMATPTLMISMFSSVPTQGGGGGATGGACVCERQRVGVRERWGAGEDGGGEGRGDAGERAQNTGRLGGWARGARKGPETQPPLTHAERLGAKAAAHSEDSHGHERLGFVWVWRGAGTGSIGCGGGAAGSGAPQAPAQRAP